MRASYQSGILNRTAVIYYMNKNNENDTSRKSEINANMVFTQSLWGIKKNRVSTLL
jgi:hypothetical protein